MNATAHIVDPLWRARALATKLRRSHLTLVHGTPGGARSQLLRSGLLPLLRRRGTDLAATLGFAMRTAPRLPERRGHTPADAAAELAVWVDDWSGDPAEQVLQQLRLALPPYAARVIDGMHSLPDALARVRDEPLDARLLFIFDRFEDCLLAAAPGDARQEAFYDALSNVVNDPSVPAHLMLSVSEDAGPLLLPLKARIDDFAEFFLRSPAASQTDLAGTGVSAATPAAHQQRTPADTSATTSAPASASVPVTAPVSASHSAPASAPEIVRRAAPAAAPTPAPAPRTQLIYSDIEDTLARIASGRRQARRLPPPAAVPASATATPSLPQPARTSARSTAAAPVVQPAPAVAPATSGHNAPPRAPTERARSAPPPGPGAAAPVTPPSQAPGNGRASEAPAALHAPVASAPADAGLLRPPEREPRSLRSTTIAMLALLAIAAALTSFIGSQSPPADADSQAARTAPTAPPVQAAAPAAAQPTLPSGAAGPGFAAELNALLSPSSSSGGSPPIAALAPAAADPADALAFRDGAPRLVVAHYDALQAARSAVPPAALQIVAPLAVDEVLFVVPADSPLDFVHQMAGSRLDAGPAGTARALTAATVLARLFGGDPAATVDQPTSSEAAALRQLVDGGADIVVLVGTQALRDWASTDAQARSRFKLLQLDVNHSASREALQAYLPLTLRASDHDWLAQDSATLGLMSFVVAPAAEQAGDAAAIELFAARLCTALPELRRSGDAKWHQVSPLTQLPVGWPYSATAASAWAACPALDSPLSQFPQQKGVRS